MQCIWFCDVTPDAVTTLKSVRIMGARVDVRAAQEYSSLKAGVRSDSESNQNPATIPAR